MIGTIKLIFATVKYMALINLKGIVKFAVKNNSWYIINMEVKDSSG